MTPQTIQIIQYLAYVVMIGSLISALLPPPLSPTDTKATGLKKLILKSAIYGFIYRFVSFCSLNVGWAKNFADPKIIKRIQTAITATAALASFLTSSSAKASAAPSVSGFTMDGEPLLTALAPVIVSVTGEVVTHTATSLLTQIALDRKIHEEKLANDVSKTTPSPSAPSTPPSPLPASNPPLNKT